MPYLLDAVNAYATLGEIMGVMRKVCGEYRELVGGVAGVTALQRLGRMAMDRQRT